VDSREDLRADQPPARRGARLPRPRLRRGDTGPSSPIDPVLKKVRGYNPKADVREIARAYAFAESSHEGQTRKSGEEFITHPLAVTEILADLRLDTHHGLQVRDLFGRDRLVEADDRRHQQAVQRAVMRWIALDDIQGGQHGE